jgi:predicted anti-sigma-YlaC factor YlaD
MNELHDDCGLVRNALGLYYFGELTEPGLVAVERHLALCQRCLTDYSEWGEFLQYFCTLGDKDTGNPPAQTVSP